MVSKMVQNSKVTSQNNEIIIIIMNNEGCSGDVTDLRIMTKALRDDESFTFSI